MRIERIRLHSFGCLDGEFHFASDRPTLILASNEAGKSTLAEAIWWLLFGVPKKRDLL